MGQAKKMWMDLQERGDWPDELENKFVCPRHFHVTYLKRLIHRHREVKDGKCSYCGRCGEVCSMQHFMEQVSWKIHLYYDDVNNADLLYASSFYDDENEVITGFKRVSEYVVPQETEYFESTQELMNHLGLNSDNEQLNSDIESVFTTDEWIERDILHEDYGRALINKWQSFVFAVTHNRRYTFLATSEFLPLVKGEEGKSDTDILSSLKSLIIQQKLVHPRIALVK